VVRIVFNATNDSNPSAVTWNNVGLVNLYSVGVSASYSPTNYQVWYMVAPASGSNTLAVSFATATNFTLSAVWYTGVNQGDPLGAHQDNANQSSPGSYTSGLSTTAPYSLITDFLVAGSCGGTSEITPGGGQNLEYAKVNCSSGDNDIYGDNIKTTTEGSYNFTYTLSPTNGSNWNGHSLEIFGVGCSAATPTPGTGTPTPTLSPTTACPAPTPNFGPNVLIFNASMSSASIQTQINNVYSQQSGNQFGSERYALLFEPGSYNNTVNVGYYTQVLGLGQVPDDVLITGGVTSNAALSGNNATCNFWQGAENMAVVPSGGTDQWAVSQGCPMRRMHIEGNIILDQNGGWASGGFLGDSKIDDQINSGTQQQWISRNSQWGSWAGSNWNMVFVGDGNAPSGSTWPNPPDTVINNTPVSREKPFLQVDSCGNFSVFVPSLATNSQGVTWAGGATPGTAIPISQFYIAQASVDTAATMNAALAKGLNLLLTPGVYSLTAPLNVTNANTVVLGLGLATLLPQNGVEAMTVADVDGVTIAGILFDAGPTSSPILLQVGPVGSGASHAANPTLLSDLFFRVGGAAVGQASVCLQINSNNVIGDDFWIWRADHGASSSYVGWTVNTANNGLVVNGNNVTIYGLACEHFQQYQTLWNGNGGSVYFYQSEAPYDPPNQAAWMAGTEDGYASYKVADTVTSHTAYGVGVYCYFDVNPAVILGNAIEVPASGLDGAMFHNMTTVSLGGVGQITNIINGYGNTVNSTNTVATLAY
jgi:hypothetical protein